MKPQCMEIYLGLRNHSLGTNGTNMPSIIIFRMRVETLSFASLLAIRPRALFRRAFNTTSMNNSQLGL